jgi:hypothetical protein
LGPLGAGYVLRLAVWAWHQDVFCVLRPATVIRAGAAWLKNTRFWARLRQTLRYWGVLPARVVHALKKYEFNKILCANIGLAP